MREADSAALVVLEPLGRMPELTLRPMCPRVRVVWVGHVQAAPLGCTYTSVSDQRGPEKKAEHVSTSHEGVSKRGSPEITF